MSLPKPCPSLPRWVAWRSTGFGDGDTHARTHARARLDFQPCFYDSVTGPVTGPLLNLGFCVSLAESRLGMSSASHHGADVLRGPRVIVWGPPRAAGGALRQGGKNLGSGQTWVQIPALQCFRCVTLDLLLNLSESQAPLQ